MLRQFIPELGAATDGLRCHGRGEKRVGEGGVDGAIASPVDFEILPGWCPGRLGHAAYDHTASASCVETKGTRCKNLHQPTHNRKVVVREQEAMCTQYVSPRKTFIFIS